MELTKHAQERIEGRTKMLAKDVLRLIKAGAFINLGTAEEYEYLLFYSPFDQTVKVAVTSCGREHLISIWEMNFTFPAGIEKIGNVHIEAAQSLCKKYIFSTFHAPDEQAPYWDATIEIRQKNGQLLHTLEVGTLTQQEGKKRLSCVNAFRAQLLELDATVVQKYSKSKDSIYYYIVIRSKVINQTLWYRLKKKGIRQLRATTAQ